MSAALDTKPLRGPTNSEWLPVIAGLLILYVPVFYDMAALYWNEDDYANGPTILAVIVWLIWDKRQMLLTAPSHTAPAAGLGLLTFGLLLYVLGRLEGIPLLEVGALVPILAGVLLAMRGWSGLRALSFMLLFIGYLVPPPGFLVDAMTFPLKKGVSVIAEKILYTAGYPISHDGVMLSIGQYQLLVADACSGLTSMLSLTALGLLYLYLMRYKSWLHNSLILVSLLPIAFTANVVRVILLVLVTYHYGDAAGQGFVHRFSGMVLFVIALVSILLFDSVLSKCIKPRKPA